MCTNTASSATRCYDMKTVLLPPGTEGHCRAATGCLPHARVSPTLTYVSQTYYGPVLSNGLKGKYGVKQN